MWRSFVICSARAPIRRFAIGTGIVQSISCKVSVTARMSASCCSSRPLGKPCNRVPSHRNQSLIGVAGLVLTVLSGVVRAGDLPILTVGDWGVGEIDGKAVLYLGKGRHVVTPIVAPSCGPRWDVVYRSVPWLTLSVGALGALRLCRRGRERVLRRPRTRLPETLAFRSPAHCAPPVAGNAVGECGKRPLRAGVRALCTRYRNVSTRDRGVFTRDRTACACERSACVSKCTCEMANGPCHFASGNCELAKGQWEIASAQIPIASAHNRQRN
jgi:hypothetical protein